MYFSGDAQDIGAMNESQDDYFWSVEFPGHYVILNQVECIGRDAHPNGG